MKIINSFTPLPIHFQLNLNTNTECVNSLNVKKTNKKQFNRTLHTDHDITMDEAAPVPRRPEVRVLLRARHGHAPDFLPRLVQILVDREDTGVVRRNRVALVRRNVVKLEEGNIGQVD